MKQHSPLRVLLMTPQAQVVQDVHQVLDGMERLCTNGACGSVGELASALELDAAGLALVDIDEQPSQTLRELETLTRRFPSTRFVVLSEQMPSELLLAAMQAGARHFITKQSLAEELAKVLEKLTAPPLVTACGSIVTVLSAAGGCGATTLAVNLACDLHQATGSEAAIVDMDAARGAVGEYLGLTGQYGLADVLLHSQRIDPQLVRSTAVSCGQGLHALLSPASVNFSSPQRLEMANLPAALEAFSLAWPFTVIDAPRAPMDVAARLARSSAMTLLVFQLNVKDVRAAGAMMKALSQHGITGGRLVLLANRYRKGHSMVGIQDAAKALGGVAIETVANDYHSAIRAMNYGQPLAQAAPRSDMRKDINRLARHIVRSGHPLTIAC